MNKLQKEVERIIELRELYLQMKNFSFEFSKEKPSLKKDLEWLSSLSDKAIENCENAIYSKNLYSEEESKRVIFEFESRNQIITKEISKIKERISQYLTSGKENGFYKGFSVN